VDMEAIQIPSSMIRVLTADDCEAKAEENLARLEGCIDPKTRREIKAEVRGWQRLAAVRA
jgi:hypothetical protein